MIIILLILGAAALFVLASNSNSSSTPASTPFAPSPQIAKFAQAIARAEGSNPAWNNPGDLTISFGYPTFGAVNSAGVLRFQNPGDGWAALYHQLSAIVNGSSRYSLTDDTIASFGQGYSGGDANWAVNVSNYLGVTPDTPLNEVLT
jgi:hypothetical protein